MMTETDPTRRLAGHYSGGAEIYERIWVPALRPFGEQLIESMTLQGARRVLDAATGVGALLPALRKASGNATLVGVDVAMGMLQRASREAFLANMDLRRLGFADAAFDAAVAAFVLFHLPRPAEALKELSRVLRQGGRLGTITWEGEPSFRAQAIWNEEMERQGAANAAPGLTDHSTVNTAEKVHGLLEGTGFVEIRTCHQPFRFTHDPESFITLRMSLGSSRERFQSVPDTSRRVLLKRVRQRFAELAPEDLTDTTGMIFATACRA